MIDTIGIISPPLSDTIINYISGFLIYRTAIDMEKGETIYKLTSGSLPGSYSHGVSVQIVDIYEYKKIRTNEGTELFRCLIGKGIRVESSLHKAMLGHNVYGGPTDFQLGVKWYIGFIEKLLKLKKGTLPCWENWQVYRVDIAKTYYFENPKGISQYITSLVQAKFPRGQVDSYGSHGLTVRRRRDLTPKIYHKGPEFKRHDFKVLSKTKICYNKLRDLQDYADHVLRVEVEIKRRILKEKFSDGKNLPKVVNLTYEKLLPYWEKTIQKLTKERSDNMNIVRNVQDVQDRLNSLFGSRMARSLMGTWYNLTTLGEESTLKNMAYSTFRKHINHLENAGISWKATNVGLLEETSSLPVGFNLFDLHYQDLKIHPRVINLLKKVA